MLFSIILFLFSSVNWFYTNSLGDLPFIKAKSVTTLDNKVIETSGLIYFNDSFWTINDSGNSNMLYRLDPQDGSVIAEIKVSNSENVDWEELTQDQNYIYIADIGDNEFKRTEKQIYRIKKAEIAKAKTGGSVNCDIIRFEYPEMDGKNVKFNAEALIAYNGLLHIFTKDFFETHHFTISPEPGKKTALYIEKFKSNGQVTGAAIDSLNERLVMVGYLGMGDRLFWEIRGFSDQLFFADSVDSFSLGKVNETSQVEAVCFGPQGQVFITNENTWNVKQQLWSLPQAAE
ncbi:hypothetical protein [Daejeonella oryzae]|uniref:hypothetical protein n=1 Tax=Daejeonella oryzae TaxID=1122943 RepID=UPI0003FC5B54|nr:hypothetical protein [Daejeonella oryzae]